jgi:hypothetical protein
MTPAEIYSYKDGVATFVRTVATDEKVEVLNKKGEPVTLVGIPDGFVIRDPSEQTHPVSISDSFYYDFKPFSPDSATLSEGQVATAKKA